MIRGFSGTTLIDFPGRIASIVFIGGCNFRCPFCHNPELVLPDLIQKLPILTPEEVLEELQNRMGFIQGVTITGGEPLVWDRLINFVRETKSLGLEVKIDTNCYF
ncbi:MAG TPA: radical SAM protein, partial [candidate division WOR-3 bacterium]|nr:radical SAM protein [candidate division WOR-3 bacterium]